MNNYIALLVYSIVVFLLGWAVGYGQCELHQKQKELEAHKELLERLRKGIK